MNPTIIAIAICAALSGASGFWGAWTIRGRAIDQLKLEQKDERIAQQRAARASIERATGAVIAAQNEAVVRTAVLRRDADSVRSELDRLRIASSAAVRAASTGLDACIGAVHAYDLISTQCAERYSTVARDADGHASDTRTLTAAWPK